MGKTRSVRTKKRSELQLVIHNDDVPSKSRVKELKAAVANKFNLEDDKIKVSILTAGGGRKKMTVEIKTTGDELIVAALETFMQLLGNIRIYNKVINYKSD